MARLDVRLALAGTTEGHGPDPQTRGEIVAALERALGERPGSITLVDPEGRRAPILAVRLEGRRRWDATIIAVVDDGRPEDA